MLPHNNSLLPLFIYSRSCVLWHCVVLYALCRCLQFVQCLEFNLNFWHWLTGAKIKSISEFKGWLFCNVFFVILVAAASWLPACEMWVWAGHWKKSLVSVVSGGEKCRVTANMITALLGRVTPIVPNRGVSVAKYTIRQDLVACSPPELVAWCPPNHCEKPKNVKKILNFWREVCVKYPNTEVCRYAGDLQHGWRG